MELLKVRLGDYLRVANGLNDNTRSPSSQSKRFTSSSISVWCHDPKFSRRLAQRGFFFFFFTVKDWRAEIQAVVLTSWVRRAPFSTFCVCSRTSLGKNLSSCLAVWFRPFRARSPWPTASVWSLPGFLVSARVLFSSYLQANMTDQNCLCMFVWFSVCAGWNSALASSGVGSCSPVTFTARDYT